MPFFLSGSLASRSRIAPSPLSTLEPEVWEPEVWDSSCTGLSASLPGSVYKPSRGTVSGSLETGLGPVTGGGVPPLYLEGSDSLLGVCKGNQINIH